MKTLLLATAITLASFSTVAATKVPYDNSAIVKKERKPKAQAAAAIVKIYGYRCDTISAFQPMVFSDGYTISCNRFRYTYELEDKGGRWVVTVD